MNDANFLSWLKDSAAIGVVLIEAVAQIGGVETVLYMSTHGYNTGPADVPPHTHYQPIASVGTLFVEQLSLTGDGGLSAGDIEIDNRNGVRDGWRDYVWTNRTIKAYVGDVRWPRADFRLIFDGIVADIAPNGADQLLLKLRDKLQRLNAPISETKLGGATENADALLPVLLGECHNVTPLLSDPATLEFTVHAGAAERIVEVRDNGVPLLEESLPIFDAANGKFRLSAGADVEARGAITVSVQGDNQGGYRNTCAQLVRRLTTGYGKALDRFTVDDLDLANLAAFDAAHQQPMGLYAPDRMNVLTACQMLAGSLGAQLVMSSLGKLRIIQVALPAAGAAAVVRPEQMVEDSMVPVGRTEVVGAVKIGFAKNWTVQSGLVTNIPEEHKALFATEWLTTTKSDNAVVQAYRLNTEPVQQDTMLLRRVDAEAEAERRLNLWKIPRNIYEFEGLPELLLLELGQPITVYYPRFGMAAGVTGMVLSIGRDWSTGRVKVGFIV